MAKHKWTWGRIKEHLGDMFLAGSGLFMLLNFIWMSVHGPYMIGEPNDWILYSEIVLAGFIFLLGIERFWREE